MKYMQAIKDDLLKLTDAEKASFLPKFFQAFPGGYGEGDRFIGVTVPNQRKVAKKYYKVFSMVEVEELLKEPIHEYRLTALIIMVLKYEKSNNEEEKKSIVDIYLDNTQFINNWDLVDSSADKILGPYFLQKDKDLLYKFLQSGNLWKQRIAVLTTYHFIRNHQFDDTLKMTEVLISNKHDLIHKAVGWMLREIGNRDIDVELNFLKKHYKQMPRTMLRYAIEKFEESLRQQFLKGLV
ncbi:MAG: DNA alkylation repair protein [Firmicutes bacterium HGW-Firmicutes-14]|nr:MAG: DNA alkylation repair protein [Firmicutes bacterium HGW-Firmicutes-14]